MAALSDILGKSGFSIDKSGAAVVPGSVAPTTLTAEMGRPGTALNPTGGVSLSPAVSSAVAQNDAMVGMQGELIPGAVKPVYGPPTPPAFSADVPTTMDAGSVAGAMSGSTVLPTIPEQKPFLMADGRYYNPATGVSGATSEEAMGIGKPSTSGPTPPPGPAEAPGSSGKTSETTVSDDITKTIESLFPESDTLVKQYGDLRKSSGLVDDEAKLAAANREAADMQAVIDNIESEVRAQAGGMADESFIQATIADRIRRLMPQINRINANVKALSANVQSKKDTITEQLGFSQQDIANARQERNDLRAGINDMLATFGSAALAGVAPGVIAELEKRAGLPPGSLAAKAKTIDETKLAQKSYDFQVAGNKLFKLDRSTGEVVDTGVTVPDDEKSAFEQAIEIAKVLPGVSDPDSVLQFITQYSGGGTVETTKKVGQLNDDELSSVIVAMAGREGFGADPNNRPTRNNNPLNIKLGARTKHWVDEGLATVEKAAAEDGGNFLVFKDAETGLKAAEELIKSDLYSGLSLDAALKKWSGGGYGAEIVQGQVGTLGSAFTKPGAVPKLSTKAPADISLIANRVISNAKIDEKDRIAFAKNYNSLIESGDVKGALQAVKTFAIQALPVAQYNEYQDNNNASTKLTSLTNGLSQFQSVNPNLYKTILEKGKTLVAASKDPEWLKLMARIEDIQTVLRKTLFGTAVTNRESSTGESLFVDPKKDTLQDMQIKLNNLKASATGNAASILNQALGL